MGAMTRRDALERHAFLETLLLEHIEARHPGLDPIYGQPKKDCPRCTELEARMAQVAELTK